MKAYDKLLEDSKLKTQVLMYAATYCGPCKKFIPMLKKIEREEDLYDLTVIYMDQQRYPNPFNVRSVPSTIVFKNGKAESGLKGFVSESKFRQTLNEKL